MAGLRQLLSLVKCAEQQDGKKESLSLPTNGICIYVYNELVQNSVFAAVVDFISIVIASCHVRTVSRE